MNRYMNTPTVMKKKIGKQISRTLYSVASISLTFMCLTNSTPYLYVKSTGTVDRFDNSSDEEDNVE